MRLETVGIRLAQEMGNIGMAWSFDKTLEETRMWFRLIRDLDISVERCAYDDDKAYEVEIQYKKELTTVGEKYQSYEIALRTALIKACEIVS